MTNPSTPLRLGSALAALLLLLLAACGALAPDFHFGPAFAAALASGGGGTYGSGSKTGIDCAQPWAAAYEHVLALADELERDTPDAIALPDAVTWRQGGAIRHDDVELLLDVLWRRDLRYEIASEVLADERVVNGADVAIRHLVLVRQGAAVTVTGVSHGWFTHGRDGWASAELATPVGAVTLTATGLDAQSPPDDVDELLDALAFSTSTTIVGCGLDLEDPAVDPFAAAGFAPACATGDGLLLERGGAAREQP